MLQADIAMSSHLQLTCDDPDHTKTIMGMTEAFVWEKVNGLERIKEYKKGNTLFAQYILEPEKAMRYRKFKTISATGSTVIESESIENPMINSDKIYLHFIEACSIGIADEDCIAVSMTSRKIYNTYRLFYYNMHENSLLPNDEPLSMICETEDPVVVLPKSMVETDNSGACIRAYGYNIENEKEVLRAVSYEIDNKFLHGTAGSRKEDPKEPLLSVIIPVYNSEAFLARTISSVLLSSIWQTEIILVEDHSSDRSPEICDWYAEHFGCIHVIHNETNCQVSKSRNIGLAAARGEYVAVLDNDDIVHPYMYELLYKAAENDSTDCAIARTVIRNGIHDIQLLLGNPRRDAGSEIVTNKRMYERIGSYDNIFFVAVWNKIIRREKALMIQYPEDYPDGTVIYEDTAYTGALYSYIDAFSFVNDAYYIWDKRRQQTLGTSSTDHSKRNPEEVWRAYIYAYAYPITEGSRSNELAQKMNFKKLAESFNKFQPKDSLYRYWVEHMKELVTHYKLDENSCIMSDPVLRDTIYNIKNL